MCCVCVNAEIIIKLFSFAVCSSRTHLHDGILEVVEVDWFEALELRVPATQVVE